MIVQIQPLFREAEAWQEFAEKEGLRYEVLELSVMSAAEAIGEAGKHWYCENPGVYSLHGNFMDVNPVSGDKDIARLSLMKMEESCRLAKELGVQNVVFHGSAFPFLRGAYLEGWAKKSAHIYKNLAKHYGLHIFVENSQDLDPLPLQKLMEEIQDPSVSVCLDLGHAHYSRAGLSAWIDSLEKWIGYLHVSDNQGEFDDHCVLGRGTLDWEPVKRLIKKLPVDTPFTLETGNLQNTICSLSFLREQGIL